MNLNFITSLSQEFKNTKKFITSVTKGGILLLIGALGWSGANFIFRYILLHQWSPENYGVFTLIIAIVNLLVILTETNLNATTTIFLAKDLKNKENKKILLQILTSFFLLVLIIFILSLIIVYLVDCSYSSILNIFHQYFGLIWLLTIIMGITAIGWGVARAYKKMNFDAYSKIAGGIIMLGLLGSTTFLFSQYSIKLSIIILILSQFIACLVILFLLKKNQILLYPTSLKKIIDKIKIIKLTDIISVTVFSFYMNGISMLTEILFSINKLMIPSFLPMAMLGFYGGIYLIVSVPHIVMNNFAIALMPYIAEKNEAIPYIRKQYFTFLSLFALLAIILFGLAIYFAKYLLIFLPPNYNWATPIIQVLFIGMFFYSIFSLNATFIASIKKRKILKQMMMFLGSIVIINIFLNYILIPKFGLIGAAIATTTSFILIGIISTIQIIKLKPIQFYETGNMG